MGTVLEAHLDALVAGSALALSHRGRGLLQALVLAEPVAAAVVDAAREEGLVVNDVAPDAVRLAPPLIVDEPLIAEAAQRLGRALATVAARGKDAA
jgi:acetylornithine aminotransferase